MTSIWDHHGGIAFQLSTEWDEEKARRLKGSLQAVYDAIKDRPEYQDHKIRWMMDMQGLSLLGVFKDILAAEWTQGFMPIVGQFVSGDLHEFDHESSGQRLGGNGKPLLFNGRPTYGHHTETVLARARGNKKFCDIVAQFERDYRY